MANGRVQAPDLQGPEALRSVAPVDTYAAPEQPMKDNRLASLADALGSFNSGLQQFGTAYATHQRLSQKNEKDDFEKFKAAHTQAEFLQSVKDGTIPRYATPQAQAAVDYTHGQYTANTLRDEVASKVQTGELKYEDGSAQAYASQRRDEIVKANGWQAGIGPGRGFGESYNSLFQQLQTKGIEATAQAKATDFNAAAFQQVEMFATNAQQKKLTPEQTLDELGKLKGTLGTAMHLTPKEIDDTLVKELGRRIDQDPNWVLGVATGRRKDENGKPLPPLSDNPAYADVVNGWRKKADTFNAAAVDQKVEDQYGSELLGGLLKGDGSFNNVSDRVYRNPVSGVEMTVKAEKQRELAVARYETASQKQALDNRETSQQQFEREAGVFIANDLDRPQWKREITAGPNLANNTDLTNPGTAKRLVAAAQTYDKLEAMSPAYVRGKFDDKTRNFYTAFRVLKDYATNPDGSKLTDVQALNAAGNGIKADSPETADHIKEQVAEAANKINSLTNPNSLAYRGVAAIMGWEASNANNVSAVHGELRRLATVLARSGGVSGKDAVDAAARYMAQTSSVVNGQWMPKEQTGGLDVTTVFPRVLSQYVTQHGKEHGYAARDLTVRSTGDGYFMVTDRSGLPVPAGPRLSRSDLMQVQGQLAAERQAETLRQQQENARKASDNAALGGGVNILPPKQGPAAPGPEVRQYRGLGDGSVADKAAQQRNAESADGPSRLRQMWDDLTQGDPQAKIDEVMSGRSGVNPDSPLGRSILEHQQQRIREKRQTK